MEHPRQLPHPDRLGLGDYLFAVILRVACVAALAAAAALFSR